METTPGREHERKAAAFFGFAGAAVEGRFGGHSAQTWKELGQAALLIQKDCDECEDMQVGLAVDTVLETITRRRTTWQARQLADRLAELGYPLRREDSTLLVDSYVSIPRSVLETISAHRESLLEVLT